MAGVPVMTGGLGVDLIVVMLTGAFMLIHDRRAVSREVKRQRDHDKVMVELRANAHVFLQAVDQRHRTEQRVDRLEEKSLSHESRLLQLEQRSP
jgi:hypothetical protein